MILNVKDYGLQENPAVFFLHGLLGSADNWGSTCRSLSEAGLRCIAVDQRNHGASPHSSEMNYPLMADDLLRLADSLGIDEFSLVGHSMGGKTAMEAALRAPERLRSMVVADIAPIEYKPAYTDYINSLGKINLNGIKNRSEAGLELEKYIPDRSLRMFFLTNLRKDDSGKFRWRININSITSNYENIWKAIENGRSYGGPVLFLRGSESDFVQDKHFDLIESLFPAFEVKTIENSGHWVHTEQPEVFRQHLSDFLTR
ncbi:MAG: alpha/beta fold hydrolase [Spirochaetales bacterium]|nr:alpha/beta fold hydrolase [Spirochaetales bacterium]